MRCVFALSNGDFIAVPFTTTFFKCECEAYDYAEQNDLQIVGYCGRIYK